MEDGEGKAATVMVLLEALKYEKANNIFKARHWSHYRQNFSRFHQATVEKLREQSRESGWKAIPARIFST